MTKVKQIVKDLLEEGSNRTDLMYFLCDGAAMASMGISDSDQSEVEEVYDLLQKNKSIKKILDSLES